jgi:hypothetical protein
VAEADADELEVAIAGALTESADESAGSDEACFAASCVDSGAASGTSDGALATVGASSEAGRLTATTVVLFPEVLS